MRLLNCTDSLRGGTAARYGRIARAKHSSERAFCGIFRGPASKLVPLVLCCPTILSHRSRRSPPPLRRLHPPLSRSLGAVALGAPRRFLRLSVLHIRANPGMRLGRDQLSLASLMAPYQRARNRSRRRAPGSRELAVWLPRHRKGRQVVTRGDDACSPPPDQLRLAYIAGVGRGPGAEGARTPRRERRPLVTAHLGDGAVTGVTSRHDSSQRAFCGLFLRPYRPQRL
jgi:hypothetical protein